MSDLNIRFYNTLTNELEEFQPQEAGHLRMYSCGPTVYDFAHIGNFRSFLFADVIRRFFELAGYDVHHVSNITDVGHMTDDAAADGGGPDKMEVAIERMKEDKKSGKVPDGAIEDAGDPYQIAQYFTDAFLEDAKTLRLALADEYPENVLHATQHIDDMIAMISQLIEKEHAYVGPDGVVYYSVESFPAYGRLSGNTLDKLISGAGGRVSETDQSSKRHPADFMLWKPDQSHIMKWDSPWGTGYPGWHIECSCMARNRLGRDVIDIHTGGEDLIFPHHECEIAQTCGATGQEYFARYWLHARFLLVEGIKMSKSKGNFYTVRDVLEGRATGRDVNPAVLRYELIKSHYRANMNFTKKGLQDSAGAVKRLNTFHQSLVEATGGEAAEVDLSHPIVKQFAQALADDLNMAGAIGAILPWAGSKPDKPAEALGALLKINHVLGVIPMEAVGEADSAGGAAAEIADLCKQLDAARAAKDWGIADSVRDQIIAAGYAVKTTPEGTVAEKELA